MIAAPVMMRFFPQIHVLNSSGPCRPVPAAEMRSATKGPSSIPPAQSPFLRGPSSKTLQCASVIQLFKATRCRAPRRPEPGQEAPLVEPWAKVESTRN